MFIRGEALYAMYKQSGFGVTPSTGIKIPRGANFVIDETQAPVANPQVQADGIERTFGLGSHTR
jgi:hypothetical protein